MKDGRAVRERFFLHLEELSTMFSRRCIIIARQLSRSRNVLIRDVLARLGTTTTSVTSTFSCSIRKEKISSNLFFEFYLVRYSFIETIYVDETSRQHCSTIRTRLGEERLICDFFFFFYSCRWKSDSVEVIAGATSFTRVSRRENNAEKKISQNLAKTSVEVSAKVNLSSPRSRWNFLFIISRERLGNIFNRVA